MCQTWAPAEIFVKRGQGGKPKKRSPLHNEKKNTRRQMAHMEKKAPYTEEFFIDFPEAENAYPSPPPADAHGSQLLALFLHTF